MSLVEVGSRFRVTLPREIRKTFKVNRGQRLYIVQYGEDLLVKTMPKDPAEGLQKIIGDFVFDRKARRKAERWLLEQVRKKS